jgi:hypothetical protein
MKSRSFIYALILLLAPLLGTAQSKTTEALQKKYSDAMSLFFYKNTLRMLNQKEDKAFDELIKDIEKMKLLMIKKSAEFDGGAYKKIVSEYRAEKYEEMMTSRYDGKNFDIFMKEGSGKGMLVLINDSENLFVLDIIGSIALNKVTQLYNTLDESSDIGKKIRDFTGVGNESKRRSDGDEEEDDNDEVEEKREKKKNEL